DGMRRFATQCEKTRPLATSSPAAPRSRPCHRENNVASGFVSNWGKTEAPPFSHRTPKFKGPVLFFGHGLSLLFCAARLCRSLSGELTSPWFCTSGLARTLPPGVLHRGGLMAEKLVDELLFPGGICAEVRLPDPDAGRGGLLEVVVGHRQEVLLPD